MATRVTAILNLKGGVAKTTTAANMAAILASLHNKRVLLIDGDSQCNTTEFYGGAQGHRTLSDLLRAKPDTLFTSLAMSCIHSTKYRNIDLLPGDDSLMDLDLSKIELREVSAQVLRWLLQEVGHMYDIVLIDCPPAFNAACAAALVAADDVIIPIKLDAFSLRGMGNLMHQIKNMRKINPSLKLAGVLPTMWYKSSKVTEAEQLLTASGLQLFHHIRATKQVDTMTWEQSPIICCSPRSAAAVDYKRFVDEYVGGMSHG